MKHRSIEDIVYIIENAKKNNLPKPIILIGAGVSITAGIPGTNSIVEKILEDFSEKPSIRNLDEAGKKDYYTLMDALSADERRGIFSFYNNHDRVKINLSHIYLAQLLIEDYVDFVFTPNFDDLLIKACALFNKIPPIYDLSNLNDFTTTDFQKGSITYLHGQHHGQWLLNAKGELAKTKDILPKLFNRVCNKRTWIIVGYSGSDEILDEISKFESFDNDLYWVTNKNTEPIEKVKQNLLDVELKNAFTVSGYDSDAFFLELHSGLNLETPQIFNKPFSFIKTMMLKIKDIEEYGREEKYLEKFVFLGERLDKSKEMVEKAILILENEPVNKLEQEILEAIAKNDFSKAEEFLKKSKVLNAIILNEPIANLYHNWGNHFYQLGKEKRSKNEYLKSLEKYKIAIELSPNSSPTYSGIGNVWSQLGELDSSLSSFKMAFTFHRKSLELKPNNLSALSGIGTTKFGIAKMNLDSSLYLESIEDFKTASVWFPNNPTINLNWGASLFNLYKLTKVEDYLFECIEKFKITIKVNPSYRDGLNNLGLALNELGLLKKENIFFEQSIEYFKKLISNNPINAIYLNNLATSLANLATNKQEVKMFEECVELIKESLKINPDYSDTFGTWGYALISKFHLTKDNSILNQALDKCIKAFQLDSTKTYDLSCVYALLNEKSNALNFLERSFRNKIVSINHVLSDKDWESLLSDPDFINLTKQFQ